MCYAFCMRFVFALLACLLCSAPPATAMGCTADFTITVTQAVATIRPGDQISGRATFTTTSQSHAGEGGARVHLARGEMRLGRDISGEIWAIITTAGNPVADALSVQARNVTGLDFGGIAYQGPMMISLYGRPGTLTAPTIHIEPDLWAAMDLRRSFALHAYGHNRLAGDITMFQISCDPAGMIDSGAESAYPAGQ